MIHEMNLCKEPFEAIVGGYKTIEMRLNDEKKSLVKIGDYIVFINNETGEIIKCEVVDIYHYQNFEGLYKNHCKTRLGYRENEVADPKDMLKYYSQERIDKYGVLGFQIRIVL